MKEFSFWEDDSYSSGCDYSCRPDWRGFQDYCHSLRVKKDKLFICSYLAVLDEEVKYGSRLLSAGTLICWRLIGHEDFPFCEWKDEKVLKEGQIELFCAWNGSRIRLKVVDVDFKPSK